MTTATRRPTTTAASATARCRSRPSPVGAVTLRETADGWVDLDRSSFQRSGGRDLPDMTPDTRAILVDQDGNGLLLGGVSDPSTSQGFTAGPDAPTLGGVPSVRRLDHGALAPPPSSGPAPETAETARRRPAPCASPSAAIRRAWTAAAAPAARASRPTRTCSPRSPASAR